MIENEAPAPAAETAAADLSESPAVQSSPAEGNAPLQAAPEAKPEAPAGEQSHPFWYRKRLKEIEDRAKAAERRAHELEQRGEPRQAPTFDTPQAYIEHSRIVDRLERSEDRFIDKHGEQVLGEVRDWMAAMPEAQRDAFEAFCMQQRHPWQAAHEHFQRAKVAAEIGDDPSAWRQRQEEEIRARILEELGQNPGQPPAMSAPRLPQSAAGQRSAAPRGPITSASPFKHEW